MAEPYRKGEYVRYACNGVCLVDDIRLDVPAGKGTPKEFYILNLSATRPPPFLFPPAVPRWWRKWPGYPTGRN